MKYKAVIFDLDGTAIPSTPEGMPTQRLIQAITLSNELLYFCCATGRTWSFARAAVRSLNLVKPCIISAGTQIIDPQAEKILWQVQIEESDLQKILKILQAFTNELLVNDEYPGTGKTPQIRDYNFPIHVMNLQAVTQNDAQVICDALVNIKGVACTKVVSQTPEHIDLHITNSQATKEHAVHQLCNMLNISAQEVIGIGDGYNDIHLFAAVGYKVAMGNAVPELKEKADLVIGSMQGDGLSAFFEQLNK